MSLDLAEQGVNVLWGSFEIKNTRLMHKLMQQHAREPLPTGDPAMIDKLTALADRFELLPFLFMKFHGGSDVDDVLDAMDYAVYVNDVEHIILDNMQFMVSLKSLGGRNTFDKFDVQDIAVEKFRKFATVWLTSSSDKLTVGTLTKPIFVSGEKCSYHIGSAPSQRTGKYQLEHVILLWQRQGNSRS
jgi:AAA domain